MLYLNKGKSITQTLFLELIDCHVKTRKGPLYPVCVLKSDWKSGFLGVHINLVLSDIIVIII